MSEEAGLQRTDGGITTLKRPGGTQDSTKSAEVALRLCVPPVKKVAARSLHCAPPMSDRCP